MKLISTSIIIGSIIIAITIFYSVTHEERARMQYCKDSVIRATNANSVSKEKFKSIEKNIQIICDERIYNK